MAQAFLVNFPFLFWFNNLNHFRMIFPKTREIEEPCRETVRNDKKSWDSRQNRESWQVCVYTLEPTQKLVRSRKQSTSFNIKEMNIVLFPVCGTSKFLFYAAEVDPSLLNAPPRNPEWN